MTTSANIDEVQPVKGQHIFPEAAIVPLVHKWKALIAANNKQEALDILEQITIQSTPMFIRLVHYEKFSNTVDPSALVTAAQVKLPDWLTYWDPKKGRLFSWISKCARHIFLGEVVRESQHRKRFHATSDNLEKFVGTIDHGVYTNEDVESVKDSLKGIQSRWADSQIITCIRFQISCIVENPNANKKTVIRSASFASGLNFEQSKFFYNWSLYALREAFYHRVRMPFSESDILRLSNTFTYLPDLMDVISFEDVLKLCSLFGGIRIKFPTLNQIAQGKANFKLYGDLDKCDGTPTHVAKIAKSHGRSVKSAEEIYEEMTGKIAVGDDTMVFD